MSTFHRLARLGGTLLALLVVAAVSQGRDDEYLPRYVIYYNSDASPASAMVGLPYTHVVLSFITVNPDPQPGGGVGLVVDPRLEAALAHINDLQREGKVVLLGFGGGDMNGADYLSVARDTDGLATALGNFARQHAFDGVMVDFEVSASLHQTPPAELFDGRAFLVNLTLSLRAKLGENAVIAHTPQPPYLDPQWHGGPYIDVLTQAGHAIDWIAVQYYNNPAFDAPTADDIIGAELKPRVTSFAGITGGALGLDWPASKTLVGLPVYKADASNGHLPPETVASDVICPLRRRFGAEFGGIAGWQFSTLTDDHRFWNTRLADAMWGKHCDSRAP